MALVLTSAPAVEPISVADAKAHMRVDDATEDVLISSLILTSRLHIEGRSGPGAYYADLETGSRQMAEDGSRAIATPSGSVVSSVTVLAADGTPTVLSPDAYVLEGQGIPPRLVRTGSLWPVPGRAAAGIEIAFTAGFGSAVSDVPEPIRASALASRYALVRPTASRSRSAARIWPFHARYQIFSSHIGCRGYDGDSYRPA